MWGKSRVVATMAISAVGVGLLGIGFFQITPAEAATNVQATMGVVQLDLSHPDIFAGNLNLENLAPGDHGTGTLVVTNSGSHSEWVQLDNELVGGEDGHPDIFGVYNTSIDASAGSAFATDKYPLRLDYSIQLTGNHAPQQPIVVGPFHTTQTSPAFEMASGQSAVVTYHYHFPLAAHNDYQDAFGKLQVLVNASDDVDTGGSVQGGTTPVTGLPIATLLAEGAGLVVVGGALVMFARRRA